MQRKLTYFAVFVGFLSICVFFACRKDNHMSNQDKPDPNAAMNVDLAQNYYYNSLMKKPGTTIQTNLSVNSTGSNAVPGEKNYKYLMFGLSHNSQTEKVTYIEIPLRYNRRPSSVIANDDQTGDYAAKLKILNASFDRLLIYKDKATNQIDQAVVTYIPDAEYLKKHNNDISGNQIDKLDADFNGYLEYRKWDGSSMFLLKIANGKIIKDYVYQNSSTNGTNKVQVNSAVKVNTIVCTPMYTQHWVQQCYASDPEGHDLVCQQWVLEGTDYWDDCHDDGSGSGQPLTGDPCHDYGYCGTPTPPANPPPPPPKPNDPCTQKADVTARASNSVINNTNSQIKTNSTTKEYGAEQKLQSISGSTYLNVPIRTDGSTGSFTPNFTWNPGGGYTIGWSHGHPGGSAPSPDDVFVMLSKLSDPQLTSAGTTDVQFYRNNVSVTAVTSNGNFVVTVKDWSALSTLFGTFQNNPSAFDDNFSNIATDYYNTHTTDAGTATAYALMKLFGDSINLYKAPSGSNVFQPLTLNGSNTVTTKQCP